MYFVTLFLLESFQIFAKLAVTNLAIISRLLISSSHPSSFVIIHHKQMNCVVGISSFHVLPLLFLQKIGYSSSKTNHSFASSKTLTSGNKVNKNRSESDRIKQLFEQHTRLTSSEITAHCSAMNYQLLQQSRMGFAHRRFISFVFFARIEKSRVKRKQMGHSRMQADALDWVFDKSVPLYYSSMFPCRIASEVRVQGSDILKGCSSCQLRNLLREFVVIKRWVCFHQQQTNLEDELSYQSQF